MFRLNTTRRNVVGALFVLAVLLIAAGLVFDRGTEQLTLQTAIGQTNDTPQASEDFLHLERANRAFIELVARTSPAVVQITTTLSGRMPTLQQRQQQEPTPLPEEVPEQFEDFFRRFYEDNPGQLERHFEGEPFLVPRRGLGSGVIISDDGYILTNNHVVEGADEITIKLENGKTYTAELVGRDAAGTAVGGSDIALLKIDADGLPTLPFGDSDALQVGEWVIAIGSPLNFSQTVTRGIVSAKNRDGFANVRYGNFIQTDAPINRGNSGGALINIRGELIGINTLIATSNASMGNMGLGFAVPSKTAQRILPQLMKNGKVERGWLGVQIRSINSELAETLEMDVPRGALVTEVGEDSPAAKAGIQPGDIITEFDGEMIEDSSHLVQVVGSAGVGTQVDLIVLRKGTEETGLKVTLETRTAETVLGFAQQQEERQDFFAGLRVQNLTPALAENYKHGGSERGVIVMAVEPGSDAERKGIVPGTLIKEMGWQPINSLENYTQYASRLLLENKRRVLLYVKFPYGDGGKYVTLRVDASDR